MFNLAYSPETISNVEGAREYIWEH